MEELRSTEALDNEIRSDCLKKAERILVKADESAKAILDDVDNKIQQAKYKAEEAMNERIALYEKNINASVPLEKQRYLVSFINKAVVDALNSFFDNCTEDERIEVIRGLIKKTKAELTDKKINAFYIGLDNKKVSVLLKDEFNDSVVSIEEAKPSFFMDDEVNGFKRREGLIIKSVDGKITCRVTLAEKVNELLNDKIFELSNTLFEGRLPE